MGEIIEYKDTDILNENLDANTKIEIAKTVATPLANIIEERKLYTMIGSSKHVNIEGWNTLGTMLGLAPITVENKPLDPKEFSKSSERKEDKIIAYESIVKIVTKDDQTLAQTSAICTNLEKGKEGNDHYAIRSMAETRATGKAYRTALSWIMQLAGYEVTPSSEMDTVNNKTNDVGSNNKSENSKKTKGEQKSDEGVIDGDYKVKDKKEEKTTNNKPEPKSKQAPQKTTETTNKVSDKETEIPEIIEGVKLEDLPVPPINKPEKPAHMKIFVKIQKDLIHDGVDVTEYRLKAEIDLRVTEKTMSPELGESLKNLF